MASLILGALFSIGLTVGVRIALATIAGGGGSDLGYHLTLIDAIRRNRYRVPEKLTKFVLDRTHVYPSLLHQFAALAPVGAVQRWPWLVGATCDSVMAAVAFLLASEVMRQSGLSDLSLAAGLLAGVSVALAPSLLAIGVGPRAYTFTPRPFGEMAFAVIVAAGAVYLLSPSPWLLGLGTVFAAVIFLSSKFAVQALVFSAPVALLVSPTEYMAVIPAGLVVAVVVSRGRYLSVLTGQLSHLRLYRRRLQRDHPAVRNRTLFDGVVEALRALALRPTPATVKGLAIAIERSPVAMLAFRNGHWLALLYLWLIGAGQALTQASAALAWLTAWLLAPLLPAVWTSLPPFRFLGEAERYPEYSALPAAVLLGVLFAGSVVLLGPSAFITPIPLLAYFAAFLLYTIARAIGLRRTPRSTTVSQMAAAVGSLDPSAIVLAAPMILAFELAPITGVRYAAASDPIVWADRYDDIFSRYPWPSTDLGWWRREIGATHFLLASDGTGEPVSMIPKYDVGDLELVVNGQSFGLFRL